jgi:hypothetical protein
MVPPFVVSVMADPSGAYTTAAAMVACVEAELLKSVPQGLKGQRVVVLGGTGPVGRIAGVLAASACAEVALSSRNGIDVAEEAAQQTGRRFGVTLHGISGGDRAAVRTSIADADAVLAMPQPACRWCRPGPGLPAPVADVNAVPPEGVAGVSVMDNPNRWPARQVGISAGDRQRGTSAASPAGAMRQRPRRCRWAASARDSACLPGRIGGRQGRLTRAGRCGALGACPRRQRRAGRAGHGGARLLRRCRHAAGRGELARRR